MKYSPFSAILCFFTLFLLVACSGMQGEANYPKAPDDVRRDRNGKLTGEDGLFKLGGRKDNEGASGAIGVNGYLWRATLDTISFMPFTSADPFGGVIITDWYADPKAPHERFKLNVVILSGALRADGVKVSAFKQVMNDKNEWHDAPISSKVARDLEDKILTRARQLRVARSAS